MESHTCDAGPSALKMLRGAELIYLDFDGTLMDKTAYLASALRTPGCVGTIVGFVWSATPR
jgi:hypothetical protein